MSNMNDATYTNKVIAAKKKKASESVADAAADPNSPEAKEQRKADNRKLWNLYNTKNKPLEIREQLIKKYAYIVNWVIGRFPNLNTADFDREDLLSYGTIGLIESVDRFDPTQKCSFETFAINRVRGEILDFLRSRDFLSRTSRTRVKRYNEALAKLEYKLNRAPNDDEIKAELSINNSDLAKIRQEANAMVFSLDSSDSTKPFEDNRTTLVDTIPAKGLSQEDYAEANLLRERLGKAIDSLKDRERLVISLYHYQKLTFREIGEVLGVSESRASQIHNKVVQKLRVLMRGYEI